MIQEPSPNFSSRNGYKPELVVLHCTDGNFPYDMQYLQNPNPGSVVGPVSAHFVNAPDGAIYQLVDTANAAWHAGRIFNPTAKLKPGINPNWYSIGIETSMISTEQPSDAQKRALVGLVKDLCAKYSIPIDREHIVGHHEIYSLKTCPGTINVDEIVRLATPTSIPELTAQVQKLSLLVQLYQKLLSLRNLLK